MRVVMGDLHDTDALTRATEGQDVVFHVAGVVAARNEAEFLRANRDGTANVLEASSAGRSAALRRWSRPWPQPGPRAREAARGQTSPPGRSPRTAGASSPPKQVVTASALPWTIMRPPTVYGPRDQEVLKVFRIARWGVAPVFGDGSQELSAVHGADLAEALDRGRHRPTRRSARPTTPAIPKSSPARDSSAPIAAAMGRRVAVVGVPKPVGRALLALTETGARLTGSATILTPTRPTSSSRPAWTGDPAPLPRDTGWRAAHDLDQRARRHLSLVPERGMALATSLRGRVSCGRWTACCSATWARLRRGRGARARAAWVLVAARGARPFRGAPVPAHPTGTGPVGRAIREIYPLILLAGLYAELDVLNGVGAREVHDALVQRWELALFGTQASVTWWQSAPSRFWSTVLHAAYFSYYFIVLLPALYFVWRGDTEAVRHFVLVGDDRLRPLLSRLHLLPGGRPLLPVPPAAGMVHRQPAGAAGLRHARQAAARTAPRSPAHTWPPRSRRRFASLPRLAPAGAVADRPHAPAHRGRGLLPDALRGGCRRRARRRHCGGVGARSAAQPRAAASAIRASRHSRS